MKMKLCMNDLIFIKNIYILHLVCICDKSDYYEDNFFFFLNEEFFFFYLLVDLNYNFYSIGFF
jgi:hypothetical protein